MDRRLFLVATAIALTAGPMHVYGVTDPRLCLKGIVLVADKQDLLSSTELNEVEGIWIDGPELVGGEDLILSLLNPAFEKPFSAETLDYIKEQLVLYYKQANCPVSISIASISEKNKVVQITIEKPLDTVRGIVLLDAEERLLTEDELNEVEGICIDGPELVGGEDLIQELLEPALAKEPSVETLAFIRAQLLEYYEPSSDWVVFEPTLDEKTHIVQVVVRPAAIVAAEALKKEEQTIAFEPEEMAPVVEEELAFAEPELVEEEAVVEEIAVVEEEAVEEIATVEEVESLVFAEEENEPIAALETEAVEENAPPVSMTLLNTEVIAFEEESAQLETIQEEFPYDSEIAAKIEEPAADAPYNIHSIVLITNENDILDRRVLRALDGGIKTGKLDLPGPAIELEFSLQQEIQKPFTEATLCAITEKIYAFYREHDRPFVLVTVPPQLPESGVAQIVVQESTLGKVEIVGNRWTSSKRYSDYFLMKPGQPISQKQLRSDVNFMNRNPYRFVNVVYSPGEQDYTTDLTLEVSDRKPYFFYAGFDNFGVPTTGRQRVFAGFSWDQIFGLDQSFFYQYTTNYHVKRYHANSFQYMAMLPWKSILNIYGGFSVLSADLDPAPISNQGTNVQASIRYIAPFSEGKIFSQEWIAGFDLKNTNNTVEFSEQDPVFGPTVNLSQWILGYKCKYLARRLEVEAGLDGVFSPFQWLPNQSKADFASLRPDADNTWFYADVYCDIKYGLPYRFESVTRLRGKATNATLLPSEQLCIGGPSTVRGYDERQYNGDLGAIANLELQSPRFSLFSSKKKNLANQAYFLVFADGGIGWNNSGIPHVENWNYLLSTGAGFRYYLGTYLNARVDYGVKLHHQDDFTGGPGMVQFSVSGSY